MGKTAGRVIFGAVALVLLAGCSLRGAPNNPEVAWVEISVGTTGGLTADVVLAHERRADVEGVAQRLAPVMFPGLETKVRREGNDAGTDYAVISVPHAYETGPRPSVELALRPEAMAVLRDAGIERVRMQVCTPDVPNEIESVARTDYRDPRCASWRVSTNAPGLMTTSLMKPDVDRWYRSAGLAFTVLVSAIATGLVLRRMQPVDRSKRIRVAVAAAPGVVAFVVAIVTEATTPTAHNMGVAGRFDGLTLQLAGLVPVSFLFTGMFCIVAVILTYASHRVPPPPDGWFVDPTGRHEARYRLEGRWSENVGDAGVPSADPIG